jgi:hypothetical protein
MWAAIFLYCLEFYCEVAILVHFGFILLCEVGLHSDGWQPVASLSLPGTLEVGAVFQKCFSGKAGIRDA